MTRRVGVLFGVSNKLAKSPECTYRRVVDIKGAVPLCQTDWSDIFSLASGRGESWYEFYALYSRDLVGLCLVQYKKSMYKSRGCPGELTPRKANKNERMQKGSEWQFFCARILFQLQAVRDSFWVFRRTILRFWWLISRFFFPDPTLQAEPLFVPFALSFITRF